MSSVSATAAQNCVNHQERPSAGECTECHQPICFGCQMTVAGKTVCQNCVAALRARVSSSVPNPAATVPAQGPDYNYYSGTSGSEYSYKPVISTVEDVEDLHAPPSAVGFLIGSGLGLAAGVFCAYLYAKFIFATHMNITYIAIGVGFVIGWAVVFGSKRGGFIPGMAAGGITLFSLLLTRFMLLNEYASSEIGRTVFLPMNGDTISMAIQSLTPFGWIITLIGVVTGFGTAAKAGGTVDE
ncbi:MAG: hypothetical protein V4671_02980 [Armatimonadota bacterium]